MAIATTKTVAEIAVEIPNATREFEKLGIDYCCGGSRTLGEACAEARISVDEALDRLQESMTAAPPSTGQDWQNQPLADRLTDHFALIADAALAFVCESLHACENRIGIEMRFRDHFRLEAAASPGIVEVGRE